MPRKPKVTRWTGVGIMSPLGSVIDGYRIDQLDPDFIAAKISQAPLESTIVLVCATVEKLTPLQLANRLGVNPPERRAAREKIQTASSSRMTGAARKKRSKR